MSLKGRCFWVLICGKGRRVIDEAIELEAAVLIAGSYWLLGLDFDPKLYSSLDLVSRLRQDAYEVRKCESTGAYRG